MLVLLTLVAPIAVFALLLTLQWYEQRWLGPRRLPPRSAGPAGPSRPPPASR